MSVQNINTDKQIQGIVLMMHKQGWPAQWCCPA